MAIIERNVVLGYGDVGIASKGKDLKTDPSFQISFYQLNSASFDPLDRDETVTPVTITMNVEALEILHELTKTMLASVKANKNN